MTTFEKWMDEFLTDIGTKLGLTKEQIFCDFYHKNSLSRAACENSDSKSNIEYFDPSKE